MTFDFLSVAVLGAIGIAFGTPSPLGDDTYMLDSIFWFDREAFNDQGPAAQAVFLEIDAQALLIRSRTLQFLSEQDGPRLPAVELAHRVTSDLKIFVGNGGRLTDVFPMTLLRTGMRATWLGPTLHDNPDVCLYLLAVGVSVLNRDTELDAAQSYEFMIDSSVRITLDENGDVQRVTAEPPSEPDQIPAVLKYQHEMMREWALKDLRQLAASCGAVGVERARELDNALGFTASDLQIASLLAPETTRESDAPRE